MSNSDNKQQQNENGHANGDLDELWELDEETLNSGAVG